MIDLFIDVYNENGLIFKQKTNNEKEYYFYLNPYKMSDFIKGLKDNDKIIDEFYKTLQFTDIGKIKLEMKYVLL